MTRDFPARRKGNIFRLSRAAAVSRTLLAFALALPAGAHAQVVPSPLRAHALLLTDSLKTVPPADPPNLLQFMQDRQALRRLGKALFWDQQVGSDGQACASCHYHAGADNRSKHQLNPGFRNQTAQFPTGDNTFGNTDSALSPAASPAFGPNYQLTLDDFPLHRLADVNDAHSGILSDTNDVVSSQGVFNADFVSVGTPSDSGNAQPSVFNVAGVPLRNVEPRNTPSVINAVFNYRNFWDARARNEFNGVSPFGDLDPTALVVQATAGAAPLLVPVSLIDSSLASQAVGPALSNLEMSFNSRTFPLLGRKLLAATLAPLASQLVADDDSLLGGLSNQNFVAGITGVNARYADLVQQAFVASWWSAPGWMVDVSTGTPTLVQATAAGPNLFTVMEYNFSLFFGFAIGEYMKTLRADDSPFDRYLEGDETALGAHQQAGLAIFLQQGRCIKCHSGPALTGAAFTNVSSVFKPGLLERMIMGDGTVAVYDTGHYNIGARPTQEDIGVGGKAPSGQPLANSSLYQNCVKAQIAALTAANPALTLDSAIFQANGICKVPSIAARPLEASKLLSQASALAGNPPDVDALLTTATALLTQFELLTDPLALNFIRGTSLAVQARDLFAAKPGLSAQVTAMIGSATMLLPDPVNPGSDAADPMAPPLRPDERLNADGCFKAPGLRNVEFTAPYFHNGGEGTLDQVVAFYNRGGDFHDLNVANLDTDIAPIGLSDQDKADVVAFLKALTDDRVRYQKAPFDHPSIDVPNGGTPGSLSLGLFGIGVLDDRIEVPAVGAAGSSIPLGTPGTPHANFPDPVSGSFMALSGTDQALGADASPAPFVVKASDPQGKPIAGVPVSFSAPQGAAVSPASAVTGADGTVTATATLALAGGVQSFTASSPVSRSALAFVVVTPLQPAPSAPIATAAAPKAGGCGTAPGSTLPGILLAAVPLVLARRRLRRE
jgi:cytochrome c peroxidase